MKTLFLNVQNVKFSKLFTENIPCSLVVRCAASYGKLVFVILLFLIHSRKHLFAVQIVLQLTAHLVILVYPMMIRPSRTFTKI